MHVKPMTSLGGCKMKVYRSWKNRCKSWSIS